MNQPGPIAQALAHHNMRYGTTNPVPLFTQRTEADMFPADLRGMASGVPVALARLNAAAASGLASAPGNPVSRPADHIAPTGTGSNGGHSLADPVSHGSTALKASEARAVLKRYMFGGNGAR